MHWTGFLNPPETGDFLIGMKTEGFAHVELGNRTIINSYGGVAFAPVHLEKGRAGQTRRGLLLQVRRCAGVAQLLWTAVNNTPDPAAVAAAKDADVIVAVVGLTSRLEGEEMPVSQPGFDGGDRTNLELPAPEEALVRAVAATGESRSWWCC